jgi:hypothetical protein
MTVKTYIERLVHFECSYCASNVLGNPTGYWSIGDAPIETKKDWFCPWCGKQLTVDTSEKTNETHTHPIISQSITV